MAGNTDCTVHVPTCTTTSPCPSSIAASGYGAASTSSEEHDGAGAVQPLLPYGSGASHTRARALRPPASGTSRGGRAGSRDGPAAAEGGGGREGRASGSSAVAAASASAAAASAAAAAAVGPEARAAGGGEVVAEGREGSWAARRASWS